MPPPLRLARSGYEFNGWTVEDTSKNKPYDLLCTRNDTSRRVEVKATTTAGEVVLVTSGEVNAARDPEIETDLFVVRQVQVSRSEGKRKLAGGAVQITSPWRPREEDLTPSQYRCAVPGNDLPNG